MQDVISRWNLFSAILWEKRRRLQPSKCLQLHVFVVKVLEDELNNSALDDVDQTTWLGAPSYTPLTQYQQSTHLNIFDH